MMGPLVERLHKFTFRRGRIEGIFVNMWPQWSAQLRELHFDFVRVRIDCLHRPFPNLQKMVLRRILTPLTDSDIADILKYNPQLKEFELDYHEAKCTLTPDAILRSIVANILEVESLSIRLRILKYLSNIQHTSTYFGQLKHLTKLTLQFARIKSNFMVAELCAIGAANIPLRHLCLYDVHLKDVYFQFVDAISKFKQLETLKLQAYMHDDEFPVWTICSISKHCPELSTLLLLGDIYPTGENILEITRNLKNLRSLVVRSYSRKLRREVGTNENLRFQTDTYKKLLKVVESRSEKTHLKIELDGNYRVPIAPVDLVTVHQKSLSIVWPGQYFCDANIYGL